MSAHASGPMLSIIYGIALWLAFTPGAHGDSVEHQWCRFQVGAWEIVTDLPRADVEAVVETMADTAFVFSILYDQPAVLTEVPLQIWAFRRYQKFRQLIGKDHTAGLMIPTLNRSQLLFGPLASTSGTKSLLSNARHEVTHFLQRNLLSHQLPQWQEEGQASVLGRMQWDKTSGQIEFSAVPGVPTPLSHSEVRRLLRTEDISKARPDRAQQFYHLAQLIALQSLQTSKPDGALPKGIWQRTSTDSALEPPALRRSRVRHGLRARTFQLETSTSVTERRPRVPSVRATPCLEPIELAHAQATLVASLNPTTAAALLHQIPLEERSVPQWWIQLSRSEAAQGLTAQSEESAKQALASAPEDTSAQIQFANALIQPCWAKNSADCLARWRSAQNWYRRVLQQDINRLDAAYGMGLSYLHAGKAGDSLNYLKIVYAQAPWSPMVNFYLGEAYRLVGDPIARRHLRNAAAWAPNDLWRSRANQALTQMNDEP